MKSKGNKWKYLFVLSFLIGLVAFVNQGSPELPLLKVSESGRFLVTEDDEPFFWLGDTAWDLFAGLNEEEATRYLKDRKAKGFTVIQAHLLGWDIENENAYGVSPFVEDDFSKPNESYWKHADFIINKAEELGLYMALLPAWAVNYTELTYIEVKPDYDYPMSYDSTLAYNYARFLGDRYKEKKNIIWWLGGDVWGKKHAIYDNLAKGLTETYADGDPDKILISFHPQGGTNRPPATSTSEFYHNKDWLDFNMIQSGHRLGNKNYERIAADYQLTPVKPTLESEPCYDQYPIRHDFENGIFNAWNVRRRAYWSILAGSFGFSYGANGIWQMDKPGRIKASTHNGYWYDALEYEGGRQMQFLRKLFVSRPFLSPERIPDQSLLLSEAGEVDDRIQVARAEDFSYLIAYSTNGTDFILDLSGFGKKELNIWWYNPKDGNVYNAHKIVTSSPFKKIKGEDQLKFNPPGNPESGNDWILVIDDAKKHYLPPGIVQNW